MHHRRQLSVSKLAILVFGLVSYHVHANGDDNEGAGERVVVRFTSEEARESYWSSIITSQTSQHNRTLSTSRHQHKRHLFRYGKTPSIGMALSPAERSSLKTDPRVKYIYPQTSMKLFQVQPSPEEILPYGIATVQGTFPIPPLSSSSQTTSNCQSPNSFKVCVVDDGLMVAHTDIPYRFGDLGIDGQTFGLDPNEFPWFEPRPASSHGTHVTGTILAQANNGIGVQGILPNANQDGICVLVARAFGDSGSQTSGVITQSAEWCVAQGARIVNMSLGSDEGMNADDQETYTRLVEEEGVMIVAAAGNSGTNMYSYPASLDAVVSVAAIDRDFTRARFSQFNDQVNLAAPGVDIVSTTTSNGLLIQAPNGDHVLVETSLMQYSPDTPDRLISQALSVVDCESGFEDCSNAQGQVCLIERGTTLFTEKALNCQRGGGIAALIYNNVPSGFGGSLSEEGDGVNIPVYSLAREAGLFLFDLVVNEDATTTISLQAAAASYSYYSGTSMATPHVTGVAAKIWAARPACTNLQIRTAMEASALDLGARGRDDIYGHGLVQAEAAFEYLLENFEAPCGGSGTFDQQQDDPPPTCASNYDTCILAEDCCSGRCVPISAGGGSRICRSTPKAAKNKLGGTIRGGSAGAGRRRMVRGDNHGSSAAETATVRELTEEEEPLELQDINCPFQHLEHSNPFTASYQPHLEGIVTV